MPDSSLPPTFDRLRAVVEPHLSRSAVITDDPASLYLEVPGTSEMFAAVAVKTASVAFHYMPLYRDPALLDDLSPGLRRRLKGKSCFHFRRPDDPAIEDLERLVAATAPAFLSP